VPAIPAAPVKRNIWARGALTVLMAIAFHIGAALLGLCAIVQFVLALVSETPNARLTEFGRSLGRYLGQIADFVTFASDDAPFPFSAWPPGQ
jgi:hypothetical protein